ncbi:MAG: PilZ domain-containing protein [Syntrophales bacterium]
MTETVIKKSYVDKNGMVTFICPKCSKPRRESVEHYKDKTGSIKIKCECTNVYETLLDFRQSFRKEVSLDGTYFRTSHPGDWRKMIVRDLSFWGCKFERMKACSLVPGEEIRVEFVLDNPRSFTIKKKAVVFYVKGCHVGCKFSIAEGIIDSELGFYLRKR